VHSVSRKQAAFLGRETLRILQDGCYRTETGIVVDIAEQVRRAVAGTCSYPPGADPPSPRLGSQSTVFEVVNESTLAVACRLVAAGHRAAALNFASAKNPGGGFLSGARAQEESLCRASALYACLTGNPMYDYHRGRRDVMYSHYAIYSPDVPVFRDDAGTLLDQPCPCAFLTSPAVNAGALRNRNAHRHAIYNAMAERVEKVLAVAAHHRHDALVLGAWGCGVFQNDPAQVAGAFRTLLGPGGRFARTFEHVVFGILDRTPGATVRAAFEHAFPADTGLAARSAAR
jgi:uncharacterized protein (TIGR02452 family)